MLKKLLKYDLKWVFKPLLVFYILALIFSILVRIIESFESTLILLLIDKICCGIVISMIFSILINCFMRNWGRFITNIYKDESYLTHTLPVTKNNILLSKVLTSIITLLISIIIIVICLSICTLNKDTLILLKETLENYALYFDSSILSLIVTIITTIFFELLFIMLVGILGIIIGHKSNNLKIVKSIIYNFIIYILLSIISVLILYIYGLINPNLMNIFNTTIVNSSTLKTMMIIAIIMYAIYNGLIYTISTNLLNKGVNVD